MKTMLKVLSIAAVLAASTTFAKADTFTSYANSSTFGTYTGAMVSGNLTPAPPAPPLTDPDKKPFRATYTEKVYEGGASALCPTCLNFVFTISNSATTGTDFIDAVAIGSFGTVDTKEGYVTGSGTDLPTVENIGGTITFNYSVSQVIKNGQSSVELVIFTGATIDQSGDILFQDGLQANGPALVASTVGAPKLSNAPEPSSLLLLGTGLLTAVGVGRRKLKL